MILEEPKGPSVQFEEFCRHLAEEVQSACQGIVPPQHAGDIARGVAAYLAERGVQSFSSEYLALLIGRALRGAGDESAAKHLAELKLKGGQPAELVDQLLLFDEVSPVIWNLFSSGLVRPTRWASGGESTVWVLDLNKLEAEPGECLELSFQLVIRAVLSVLAQVWDASSGEGALGLKGLQRTEEGKGERWSKEVGRFCSSVLEKIRTEREWQAVPRVVTVDAPARMRRPKSNR